MLRYSTRLDGRRIETRISNDLEGVIETIAYVLESNKGAQRP